MDEKLIQASHGMHTCPIQCIVHQSNPYYIASSHGYYTESTTVVVSVSVAAVDDSDREGEGGRERCVCVWRQNMYRAVSESSIVTH